ncbi:MAG: TlpA family protein disulfide reductase [Solirubrobacteraceae bacterium]
MSDPPSESSAAPQGPGPRELPDDQPPSSRRLDPDQAAYPPASRRLDPDRAVQREGVPPPTAEPVIDTRRYQWMIGIFGLVLVIAFSVYLFAKNGVVAPGLAPGQMLHRFVAPLATSRLNLDVNTIPRCAPAHPNPQGLNVCGRAPIVLVFFAPGSKACRREVDTLQSVSREFGPAAGIQFAAVAVRTGRAQAAALVRSHHWTIPVAYDRDGAVAELYGVEICPMLELIRAGGVVVERLIGEQWLSTTRLAGRVRRLAR